MGAQQLAEAQEGAPAGDKAAPGPDDLLDRLERTSEQDACRKHGSRGGEALDDKIGADSQYQRLHGQPRETDQALHGGGTVAGGDLALDHPDAVPTPAS